MAPRREEEREWKIYKGDIARTTIEEKEREIN